MARLKPCPFCMDAQRGVEASDLWLGDEKVNVFGHEDVAVDVEVVLSAAGSQEFFEANAGGIVVKERETAVTTEAGDVEMALVLVNASGGAACLIVG